MGHKLMSTDIPGSQAVASDVIAVGGSDRELFAPKAAVGARAVRLRCYAVGTTLAHTEGLMHGGSILRMTFRPCRRDLMVYLRSDNPQSFDTSVPA
jgi:hypothetical protein